MHCCCSKFRKIQFQCRFRPSVSITRRQCAWLDARSPSLLSGASHACVEPSWRRWRAGPPSPASSAASGPPVVADRRHTTAERRSAPPKAPWLSACPCRASARPWHRRRGPASTERAPCRRRAAPPPFRRAHPQHQVPARLAPKWDRWTSTTMPKPLIPLHIPGTAVINRRRSPSTATASGRL